MISRNPSSAAGAPSAPSAPVAAEGPASRVPLDRARLALLVLPILAITIWVAGWLAAQIGPREPYAGQWAELTYHGPFADLLSFWQRWDALWYQHIAQAGYQAGDGSTAFFPLYPFVARMASVPLRGNVVLGELLVSLIASVGAMAVIWRLVSLEAAGRVKRPWRVSSPVTDRPAGSARQPARLATVTVLAVALFPTGFFLLAPYTESLFLLLTATSLLLARTGRPWAAGIAGLLAGLTRTQGIFLALPIAYEQLRERQTLRWLRGRGGRPPGFGILAAALPIGGIVAFTLYQWIVLGEHTSGIDALTRWGYKLTLPWDAVVSSWAYITSGRDQNARLVEAFNLLTLAGFSALAVLGMIGRRRLPAAYTLYAVPSLGLLLSRGMWFSPLMSVGRYLLVVVPCFMVLALRLVSHPRLASVVLLVSAVAEIVLFQYWVRWGFVA